MSSNRVTLAQLSQMPIGEVASLPLEQLQMLLEDVAELRIQVKKADEWLTGALNLRFGEKAQAARRARGQDTGRVRVREDGYVIVADLPKKVTWEQELLSQALEVIHARGEDPTEYVNFKIDVPENKYNAWPESIRKIFTPARTVGVGKATFTIEAAKAEVA